MGSIIQARQKDRKIFNSWKIKTKSYAMNRRKELTAASVWAKCKGSEETDSSTCFKSTTCSLFCSKQTDIQMWELQNSPASKRNQLTLLWLYQARKEVPCKWVSSSLPVIWCVDPFKQDIPLTSRKVKNCPVSSLCGWFSRQVTIPGFDWNKK